MTYFCIFGILCVSMLTGCGQPSLFAEDKSSALVYHGNTKAVQISPANAIALARFVFNDEYPSSSPATGAISASSTKEGISAQAFGQHDYVDTFVACPPQKESAAYVLKIGVKPSCAVDICDFSAVSFALSHMCYGAEVFDSTVKPTLALGGIQRLTVTNSGQDGGTVQIVSEQDSVTQTTKVIMVYDHFRDQGQQLHGRIQMVTRIVANKKVQIQYQFQRLSIQQGENHVIMDGQQSITTDFNSMETVIIANYLVEDVLTGHQMLSEDFMSIRSSDGEASLSGTLYDSVLGKLNVQTDAALHISTTSSLPFAGGPLHVLGQANQSLRISPINATTAFVEADTNGDGFFDYVAGEIIFSE